MAALMAVASFACASAQPAQPTPIVIEYSSAGPSALTDLPMGSYRVPDSNVIIMGYHHGSPLGILFGAAGMLAQGAINAEQSKETAQANQGAWQLHIVQQASDVTRAALASGRYGQAFTLEAQPDAPTVSIVPYVVITFVTETEIRPSVFLKATLRRPGQSARTSVYVCCVTQALPVAGDNGLTASGGAPLKAMLAHQLETAVGVMLQDLSGAYARDESKVVGVTAVFPYQRMKLSLGGYDLFEDDNSMIFAPRVGLLYSGSQIWIMDKSAIIIIRARK